MTPELNSFVLRFVRETSQDQLGRWRGMVQHVQSGIEKNFATVSDALSFMQEQLCEETIKAMDGKGDKGPKDVRSFLNLSTEMVKFWGGLGPRLSKTWLQAMENTAQHSDDVHQRFRQMARDAGRFWGLSNGPESSDSQARLEELSRRLESLADTVAQLEAKLSAQEPQQAEPTATKKTRKTASKTTRTKKS